MAIPVPIFSSQVGADPEIEVLLVSDEQHKSLHAKPKETLEAWGGIGKRIKSITLTDHKQSTEKPPTYLVVIRHWPECSAAGICLYK